jgi:hypothetical protein
MNCDQAGRLVDDYLAGNLSQREKTQFEAHLRNCARCAQELRRWPALERSLRRGLATSVQPLSLSAAASARLVHAAGESLQKAKRSERAARVLRMVTGAAVLALLLVGILFLSGDLTVPSQLKPVALSPAGRLTSADLQAPTLPPDEGPVLADIEVTRESLPRASMLFEPRQMRPRDPFTITVFLESNTSHPLESIQLDLDVSGPTGYYRFDLAIEGPLPAQGVSILRLTPDLLAKTSQEQYLIAPSEVFSIAGAYDLRLTLFLFTAAVNSP